MRNLYTALAKTSLIAFLAFLPLSVSAAVLYLSPEVDSYSTGKTFSVRIRVNSPQSINAVSGTLTFPSDKLQVTGVSKAGSILSLWVQDPSYSNTSGTVSFEGVVPNPGYAGTGGLIATVAFKVVGAGNASVKFTNASVLANDGSGTNVLDSVTPGEYSLGGMAPVEPVKVIEPVVTNGTPRAPTITSVTHPASNSWYKSTTAVFSWNVDEGVIADRVLLGKSSNSTPTVEYNPPINTKEVSGIDEGVWYLHVQSKNSKGWGTAGHYMIKIDNTDPETFIMKEVPRTDSTDPRIKLTLSASDNYSGIKNFGIQVDKEEMEEWMDDGTGIYTTDPLSPGEHVIFARAYDQAGNFATASVNVHIEPISTPVITKYTERVTGTSPLTVSGTALPNSTVRIMLAKTGAFGKFFGTVSAETTSYTQDTKADELGQFSVTISSNSVESGSYDMTAVTIDKRGAQSLPSEVKKVLINAGFFRSLFGSLITVLAVAIPILALVFVLVVVFMRGFHKVRTTRRNIRSEIHSVERLVDKAFLLLKEDVEDSIRLLERTKSKRRLTEEEDAIIEHLRTNLQEADKVIHSEIRKIERDLDR